VSAGRLGLAPVLTAIFPPIRTPVLLTILPPVQTPILLPVLPPLIRSRAVLTAPA
jgi:hypothetical protein